MISGMKANPIAVAPNFLIVGFWLLFKSDELIPVTAWMTLPGIKTLANVCQVEQSVKVATATV